MNLRLFEQVKETLLELDIPWAICGGYALDLFLNREIRKHSDIDVCVFENDRRQIVDCMLSQGWRVYQFLGYGKVCSIDFGIESDAGRNLMCIKDGCSLVKLYQTEKADIFWYEFFHTGIQQLDYIEFLFNDLENGKLVFNKESGILRSMDEAILQRDGLRYLAPELALLYKAANTDNPDYQLDYEAVISRLSKEQAHWLNDGLRKLYPQGHPWL